MNDMESEQVCTDFLSPNLLDRFPDLSVNDMESSEESEQVCIVLSPFSGTYEYYIYTVDLAKDRHSCHLAIRIPLSNTPSCMAFAFKDGTLYMFGGLTGYEEKVKWELCTDGGFIFKRRKRRTLDAPPERRPDPDPAAAAGRRERKRKALLKLRDHYQREIDQ